MRYCLYKKILLLGFALASNVILAQTKTVSGTVQDNQGTPLPGVNVVVDGTVNGTQTDFDGNYSIEVSEGEVLRFSYIGMIAASVVVSSTNTIDVVLQEDTNLLDEVVVT